MAVDYGTSRTGLAACDRTEFLCSPLGVLTEKSMAKTAEKIVYAVREYDIGMVVIGVPVREDGEVHPHAESCRKLGSILAGIIEQPVEYIEEDNTTMEANEILKRNGKHGKKRKETEDAVAAALILERFLEKRQTLKT